MWRSTRCYRPDPGWISGREPVARPGSGRARATSRHVRTPAAPEPKDLEAVAQGLRRGDGAGGLPAPRRRAGAAGLRSDTAQVGENPVDHSGLGNEGDDAHLVSAPGTPKRVDLKDPAQVELTESGGFAREFVAQCHTLADHRAAYHAQPSVPRLCCGRSHPWHVLYRIY